MAPLAICGLRPTNRAPVFVFCALMAMHAPRILESFHVVLESFQKLHWFWKVVHAPRVLESFHVVLESFQKLHWFWKVAMWCFEKFSKAPLPHVLTLVLFSF
jgi:phenylpyruvate tautomerase PptA (4-oxalocrotonate tautomerase family)